MDSDKELIIDKLEEFKNQMVKYNRNPTSTLRAQISKGIPFVEKVVKKARTGKLVTIAPPAGIGGYQISNMNPFTLIFEAPYGMNLIQTILDIIDQTIGVIESGSFDDNVDQEPKLNKKNSQHLTKTDSKKVFIVHGHDNGMMESTARFIEKLGLNAILLHEQVNNGRTIIEKFESNSDVAYAIVLLSPDDLGRSVSEDPNIQHFRARQNVIFKLGYFIAKLGRNKVCAILKGPIETPSDYDGILYIQYDNVDGWKLHLAKEMKSAGVDIDLNLVM